MIDASRRGALLRLFALAAATATPPRLLAAQSSAKVVIVGGGFAGGACATWLSRLSPKLRVTVIEPAKRMPTGFFCNTVIGGLNPMAFITRQPGHLRERGIGVLHAAVRGIEPSTRQITLEDGTRLQADALVVAPGISMRWGDIEGYDESQAVDNPPAWPGTEDDLRRVAARLRALPKGGTLAMVTPPAPYRCPPGPYERASLFAHVLKEINPRAKILIFDAKDDFSKQSLFFEAWARHYPGMISWKGRQDGGRVQRVWPHGKGLTLASGETVAADWVHVIPAQQAAAVARDAGLCADGQWIRVRPTDFSVPGLQRVYALGDAVDMQPMPKSAFAANNQGRQCAHAIVADLEQRPHQASWLANTCYSMVAPDTAFSVSSLYQVDGKALRVANAHSQLTPLGVRPAVYARERQEAEALYRHLCHESFGAF